MNLAAYHHLSITLLAILAVGMSFVIGMLIGSINFARIIAKMKKIDLNQGSKNPGATNISRISRLSYGVFVALADLFKVLVAGYLYYCIGYFISWYPHQTLHQIVAIMIYLTPAIAVFGHCFPIYKKFRDGGKGVASIVGFLFFVSPYVGLVGFVAWWIIQLSTKYVSVASLLAPLIGIISIWIPKFSYFYWLNHVQPLINWTMHDYFTWMQIVVFIFGFLLVILVWYKHTPNIKRLIHKQEAKFYFSKLKI